MTASLLRGVAVLAFASVLPCASAIQITVNSVSRTFIDLTIDASQGQAFDGYRWIPDTGSRGRYYNEEFGWAFNVEAGYSGGGAHLTYAWPEFGFRGVTYYADMGVSLGVPFFGLGGPAKSGGYGLWENPLPVLTRPAPMTYRLTWDVAPMVPDGGSALPMLAAALMGLGAVHRWRSRGLRVR